MTLSMRERLALQKSVKQNLATLRGGEVGMRERFALQKQVKADMATLGGTAKAAMTPSKSEDGRTQDSGLADIRATLSLINSQVSALGANDAAPASAVILRALNVNGEYMGTFSIPHDGTEASKLDGARKLIGAADMLYGRQLSSTNSQRGATDQAGQLVEVVSPNGDKIAPAGSDEAAYMLGNLAARPKGSTTDSASEEAPAHERIKAAIQGGDASEAMRIARAITDKLALSEALVKAGFSIAGGTVEAILAYAWPQMQDKAGNTPPEPEASAPAGLTAQAVRGDFNGLPLPEFIEKLKTAYSADEDLEGAKEAAIGYLEANREELEAA